MSIDVIRVPELSNGDHLTLDEFLRIWKISPDIKRAELINGVVYMPSPLWKPHAKKGRHVSGWLSVYEAATPGCEGGSNASALIGDDCTQPDEYLAILPEFGGTSWGNKMLEGSPELLVEITHSTASVDLHEKLDSYEQARVQEYIVVLIKTREVRWHRLVRNKYQRLGCDTDGVFRSRVFPGLWLDSIALFADDIAKVLATLQLGIASDEHQKFVADLAKRKK